MTTPVVRSAEEVPSPPGHFVQHFQETFRFDRVRIEIHRNGTIRRLSSLMQESPLCERRSFSDCIRLLTAMSIVSPNSTTTHVSPA